MVNITTVIAEATSQVMKLSRSTIALARVLKMKPADLVETIMDREANDDYRAAMVAYAVPAGLEAAKEAEEKAKEKEEKE